MRKTPFSTYAPFGLRLNAIVARQSLCILVIIAFLANTFGLLPLAQAQEFRLPAPGVMVNLSPEFNPPILKGIKVHPDNPFRFDFILDKGDAEGQNSASLRDESTKLIKYFLASLTIPEKDLWVNLSPYEKDRIIPNSFGKTEMGRDLLAEDYMLKEITSSLIYPEGETGRKFWKRIYEEAAQKFGTTNIPVNTFNKVWIVPQKAVVYENAKAGTAYVVESKLKVMLEQDYLALQKHTAVHNDMASAGADIVREIVIPELTKEINEDKNFAHLRQVYSSLILATWYKKKIKDSILAQIYEDKKKVAGVEGVHDVEAIYQRYLRAFKKGVFNYIKEEADPMTQEMIPRKYFSGGFNLAMTSNYGLKVFKVTHDDAMVTRSRIGLLGQLIVIGAGLAVSSLAHASPKVNVPKHKVNISRTKAKISKPKANIPKPEVSFVKPSAKQVAETNKAWDEVLKNISSFEYISKDQSLQRMGISIEQLTADLEKGYAQSHYFQNNFNYNEYVRAVMTFGYGESGYKIKETNKRSDGDGYDIGIFGTHDTLLKHTRDYYLTHPDQYVVEAIARMDSFFGSSVGSLKAVRSVYGDFLFDYFGINTEAEKNFLIFRTKWHAGKGFQAHYFARVLAAMYVTPLRGSFLVPATAKAKNVFAGGAILDHESPAPGDDVSNKEKRLAANDDFLKHFEDLNSRVKAKGFDRKEWEDFKKTMRKIQDGISDKDFLYVNAPADQTKQHKETVFFLKDLNKAQLSSLPPDYAQLQKQPKDLVSLIGEISVKGEKNGITYMFRHRQPALGVVGDEFDIVRQEDGQVAGVLKISPFEGNDYKDASGRTRFVLDNIGLVEKNQRQGIYTAFFQHLLPGTFVASENVRHSETMSVLLEGVIAQVKKSPIEGIIKNWPDLEAVKQLPQKLRTQKNEDILSDLVDRANIYLYRYQEFRKQYQGLTSLEGLFTGTAVGEIREEGGFKISRVEVKEQHGAVGFYALEVDAQKPESSAQLARTDLATTAVSPRQLNLFPPLIEEARSNLEIKEAVEKAEKWHGKEISWHNVMNFAAKRSAFIAIQGGEFVGLMVIRQGRIVFPKSQIIIDGIEVRKDHQGLGIGRLLLTKVAQLSLSNIRTQGRVSLELHGEGENKVDQEFYEHLHFHSMIVPNNREWSDKKANHFMFLTPDGARELVNEKDQEMDVQKNGGIDLTPANLNLQIRNAGGDITFHLNPAMLKQLQNAPGFVPVIINIQPMTDLNKFLGIVNQTQ